MYQKEIIYMGLYKDGSRIGNAGFLKVENREEESRFQLKLQNIPYNIREMTGRRSTVFQCRRAAAAGKKT